MSEEILYEYNVYSRKRIYLTKTKLYGYELCPDDTRDRILLEIREFNSRILFTFDNTKILCSINRDFTQKYKHIKYIEYNEKQYKIFKNGYKHYFTMAIFDSYGRYSSEPEIISPKDFMSKSALELLQDYLERHGQKYNQALVNCGTVVYQRDKPILKMIREKLYDVIITCIY